MYMNEQMIVHHCLKYFL